jgi:hypothetical protein
MVDNRHQRGGEMNTRGMRWSAATVLAGAILLLSSGCVATAEGGYDGNVDVGIGVDYYDQFGYDYGSWGSGYAVGPYRGGGDRPRRGDRDGGHAGHGFRPAPPSHPVPSIPSAPRGGGHGKR